MPNIPFDSNMLVMFLPMLILSLTIIMVMIAIAVKRSHFVAGTLSVIGLNFALITLIIQIYGYVTSGTGVGFVSTLFVIDGFAMFNMLIILICSLACFTLSYAYMEGYPENKEELYLLMLTATLGAMLMVCSEHLASFFISLELLSVPMYGMLAYTFARSKSLESGLKYLVLSATASATMLMGMAFIYAYTGTLEFRDITVSLFMQLQQGSNYILFALGSVLVLFGIAFKLSAVPFHTWTPDVYQGAPAPIATFLASVGKVAMLALGLRFLVTTATIGLPSTQTTLIVIAVLSMLVGNILALRQKNIKRMLSYSSIAHLGYVLAVVISAPYDADYIASYYMAVYAFTTIGAFGVVTLMSSPYKNAGEAELIANYRGLFWQRPILTAVLTVMLLSLAGIPLTAGFITKFFAVLATVQTGQWLLTSMIIVGSAISLYYYLTLMVTLFQRPQKQKDFDAVNHWGMQAGGIMVLLVTLAVLYFGILPDSLIHLLGAVKIYQLQ